MGTKTFSSNHMSIPTEYAAIATTLALSRYTQLSQQYITKLTQHNPLNRTNREVFRETNPSPTTRRRCSYIVTLIYSAGSTTEMHTGDGSSVQKRSRFRTLSIASIPAPKQCYLVRLLQLLFPCTYSESNIYLTGTPTVRQQHPTLVIKSTSDSNRIPNPVRREEGALMNNLNELISFTKNQVESL
ncbi:hypothetical protein BDV23DRAFT_59987 [Aspergillus alliaceus]|uniref:Uncharacterized protein n=1 Tax=Petromyces alliaceus TaxID=209559 RepID=A0A5N7CET0_PETAA|nr:hypothetical protein BDV23DRAFT_59987 [Aspergillus alliaceus]